MTISKVLLENTGRYIYIAVFSDITFLKLEDERLLHLAFYDPLTKLPNRNLFFDRINHMAERKRVASKKEMAVLYMDLDNFKQVNDNFGHRIGDKLLHVVGQRLKSVTRAKDIIARVGGDEFAAIVTTSVNKDYVGNYAKRILEAINKPFVIDGKQIGISISIGISMYPADADNIEQLMVKADEAMYQSKKNGKKIGFYEAS